MHQIGPVGFIESKEHNIWFDPQTVRLSYISIPQFIWVEKTFECPSMSINIWGFSRR